MVCLYKTSIFINLSFYEALFIFINQSFYLAICLSINLFFYLSIFYLSFYLWTNLSFYLSISTNLSFLFIYLSISPPWWLYLPLRHLLIHLGFFSSCFQLFASLGQLASQQEHKRLSIYLSIFISIYLFIFIYLSILSTKGSYAKHK